MLKESRENKMGQTLGEANDLSIEDCHVAPGSVPKDLRELHFLTLSKSILQDRKDVRKTSA